MSETGQGPEIDTIVMSQQACEIARKNRHMMCGEPGDVKFFVVFPREFVAEIKLM